MGALDNLPDELLCKIMAYTRQDPLLALSLTSHALHRFVTPILYQFVESVDKFASQIQYGPAIFQYGLPPSLGRYHEPCKRSRIFHPFKFFRTIKESTILGSEISGSSVNCRNYTEETLLELVLPALACLPPSLLYLHVDIEAKLAKSIVHSLSPLWVLLAPPPDLE
jgi:hypothetical protein